MLRILKPQQLYSRLTDLNSRRKNKNFERKRVAGSFETFQASMQKKSHAGEKVCSLFPKDQSFTTFGRRDMERYTRVKVRNSVQKSNVACKSNTIRTDEVKGKWDKKVFSLCSNSIFRAITERYHLSKCVTENKESAPSFKERRNFNRTRLEFGGIGTRMVGGITKAQSL